MDSVSKRKRSLMMAGIRGKDTHPEMCVRQAAHSLGYRYRLHRRDLPGSPDLAFPKYRKVIQVHGCFWHRHAGCRFAYRPKSNKAFWQKKFQNNLERDQRTTLELRKQGWDALVVWECEIQDSENLKARIASYLGRGEK